MKLKEYRQKNKKTQKQIAEELGIMPQQYYRYETEKREIPIKLAIQLADLYKISLDQLLR